MKESSSLLKQYDERVRIYESFAKEMEHLIKGILQNSGISCNAITSRLKSRVSLAEKIDRKNGKYSSISEITDIVGVRVITYYADDVDRIAEIIEKEFDVDTANSIDKRESLEPDRFGYCSVHYVVKMRPERLALCEYKAFEGIKFEIQIRSVLQHAWAEIEHDIGYKSEITIPKEMRRSFSRIAGLLEIADKEFNQIRHELATYKVNAQSQIDDNEFLDRELDAVILQVMLESNENILSINSHISNLIKEPLDEIEFDEDFRCSISELNWLGITTVKQLNEALSTYSELAREIATENLKDYKNDSSGYIGKTIAFFYLCYALLFVKSNSVSDIYEYLKENRIGLIEDRDGIAEELFQMKLSLKKYHES